MIPSARSDADRSSIASDARARPSRSRPLPRTPAGAPGRSPGRAPIVSPIDATANRNAPATEMKNGFGCMLHVRDDQVQPAPEQTRFIQAVLDVRLQGVLLVGPSHPTIAAPDGPWNDAAMTEHRPWFASCPPGVPKTARAVPRGSPSSRCSRRGRRSSPTAPAIAWFGKHLSYRELLAEVERCSRGARGSRREEGRPRRAPPAELPAVRDRVLRDGAAGRDRGRQQPAVHAARDGAPAARLRRRRS